MKLCNNYLFLSLTHFLFVGTMYFINSSILWTLLCCYMSSVPSSGFEMQRCLNFRMTVLWAIMPTWEGRDGAEHGAWKRMQYGRLELLRENDYAGDTGQQMRQGEAQCGGRGAIEDKMATCRWPWRRETMKRKGTLAGRWGTCTAMRERVERASLARKT